MQAEPAGSPAGEDDEHSADDYGFEIPVMSPQVAHLIWRKLKSLTHCFLEC